MGALDRLRVSPVVSSGPAYAQQTQPDKADTDTDAEATHNSEGEVYGTLERPLVRQTDREEGGRETGCGSYPDCLCLSVCLWMDVGDGRIGVFATKGTQCGC